MTLASPSPSDPPAHQQDAPNGTAERQPERVCPNCGAVLYERKCKLLCPEPACGYDMSCSDFL